MNTRKTLRIALLPVSLLGLFACDLTDSPQAARKTPETTTIAPRVVMAHGGAPKASQFVRLQVKVQGSDIVRDTVYPYAMRRGRVQGIPVGAQVEIAVAGFDSVVNDAGQPELVYRWAGAKSTVAQAVTPDMDSATVVATQPVVEAVAPANVPVSLASVPSSLPLAGDLVTLPTASELGLGSDKEYRYAIDVGDEAKIVSVSAGSPKVPSDGKVDVAATSWVKVRVFSRDDATGLMLGTDGDSTLVHVPPPVPEVLDVTPGNSSVTVSWRPLELGRVQLLFREVGDTAWQTIQADGAAGAATLTGLANGTGLDVKLRTIWGPKEAIDLSAETELRSVVPVASVPTLLGAGAWYGMAREPDTAAVGWLGRSVWKLNPDGSFRLESRGYAADWIRTKWARFDRETEGTYMLRQGNWTRTGDSLVLSSVSCRSVTDSSSSEDTTWSEGGCGGGRVAYGVLSLGGGAFALRSPEGLEDTLGISSRPDPVWNYATDLEKPKVTWSVSTAGTDLVSDEAVIAAPGTTVTLKLALGDAQSGLDSLWGDGGWQDRLGTWGFRLWRPVSIDWIEILDTVPVSGSVVRSIHVRDAAGNVTTKTFTLQARQSDPDWVRTLPATDTVWVKSGTITLSGTVSSRFAQVFLDTALLVPDTAGNVSRAIAPTAVLTRKILKGIDDSGRTTFLDTLWVGLDATGPGVTWVTPINGLDTTLPAGATTRAVSVTVTDAGSGVASVTLNSVPLIRSGTTWTGNATGLVSGSNSRTLVATDALGNATSKPLTLKVKADIPLAYDTLVLGSEQAAEGSFLSATTGKVFTTLQAAQYDSGTMKQNWTLVDLVFRTDSANGHSTQGHVYSPASTLAQVSNPNATGIVKVMGAVPAGQAALATAYAAGTPVDDIAVAANDKFVLKTAGGKYALLVVGAVDYLAAYDGSATVILGR